jgi:CDP-paratose 2-epimerase
MRVLVTGSAGFIGRRTVLALTARGHAAIGLDRRDDGSPFGTRDLASDLGRASVLDAKPDVIVHLASSVSTPGSLSAPKQTFTDTVVAAANVIDAARHMKVPVVLTSSVKARDGMTPYGAAKAMTELWAMEHSRAYQLPIVINRPGTVYGPGQEGSPESGWIAWFLKAKAENLEVTLNGDGKQVRDLLYVDDYVNLLLRQVEDPSKYSYGKTLTIWDVGGGPKNAVTVQEMADWLAIKYKFGPPRYGDSKRYVGENRVPDWEPETRWKGAILR